MTSQAQNVQSASSPPLSIAMQIASAPEDIVRAVLTALCQDSEQEQKAMKYFEKLHALRYKQLKEKTGGANTGTASMTDTRPNGIDSENNSDRSSIEKGLKRKATSEIRICVQCEEPFSEDDNPSDACLYHHGSMEINDDASTWDDWEDWRSGEADSEASRKEYPEGFTWNCCDKPGPSSGCTRDSHCALLGKAYGASALSP
ncbi:hypothetical protein F5Y19DRAFT_403482 [Xylariaceae sp. FL1651]|nr:hypothetical protein F5Y19DRAFT_403482 [Xylariaceae sp. FL1651]